MKTLNWFDFTGAIAGKSVIDKMLAVHEVGMTPTLVVYRDPLSKHADRCRIEVDGDYRRRINIGRDEAMAATADCHLMHTRRTGAEIYRLKEVA